jgi:hypothetical protein
MWLDFDSKLSGITKFTTKVWSAKQKKTPHDLISVTIFMVKIFWSTCFLQALSIPAFEKLQWNKKKNTTISMCILFCGMLITNSQIMQANLTTIYLSSNYIWGYRSLVIILLST